jgi:hypothetical protein
MIGLTVKPDFHSTAKCDPIRMNQCNNLVTLCRARHTWEAGPLNKSSHLAAALGRIW